MSTIALHVMRTRGCAGEETGAAGTPASYVVQDLNGPRRGPFRHLAACEHDVCYRTLLGPTAAAIARDLSISRWTVVIYRRRAYEILRITT